MPRSPSLLCPALLALLFAAGPVPAAEEVDLAALLQRLPAGDRTSAEAVSKELVKGGRPVVDKLIGLLGGKGDAKARVALHGLALYTSRPGAEAERKAYSEALAAHLAGRAAAPVKVFLLQQLQFAGGPEVVAPAGKLLTDEELGEPAARALVAVGGDKAAEALREALPRVKGRTKLAVVQGLGVLRDKKAVDALLKLTAERDRDLRLTTWAALGNIGDAKALAALLKAVPAAAPYEKAKAVDACLVLARRLLEAGDKRQAGVLYDKLLKVIEDKATIEEIKRRRPPP
jgi:HEAT repeat protein